MLQGIRRMQEYRQAQFGFPGFSDRPSQAQRKLGEDSSFTVFVPEISSEYRKKVAEGTGNISWRDTFQQIQQIAESWTAGCVAQ